VFLLTGPSAMKQTPNKHDAESKRKRLASP
jgi:hypothetical protein